MSIVGIGWDIWRDFGGRVLGRLPRWSAISASITGAAHSRAGLPNQDAVKVWPASATARRAIVAVADGHGDKRHFRSDRGAKFAVRAALDSVAPLMNYSPSSLGVVQAALERDVPAAVVRAWRELAATDYARDDFDAEAAHVVGRDFFAAYGSTLVIAVVTEHFIAAMRLGDGDILAVDSNSEVHALLPPVYGEAVDSLCSDDAAIKFVTTFKLHSDRPPVLVTVSTDGYRKSFPADQRDFLRVGSDLLARLRQFGPDQVSHDLPFWLADTSRDGSGDDLTAGILYRPDALKGE